MITLISAAAGLLGSALPEVIHYFTSSRQKKRELELFKLKKLYQIPADEEQKRAGNLATNWLVASVRPAVTFGLFLMFCFVKAVIVYAWAAEQIPTNQMINLFWDQETRAFFAAVIGFWFGHRALSKLKVY